MKLLCVHCGISRATRPRRLCNRCYYHEDSDGLVRLRYPMLCGYKEPNPLSDRMEPAKYPRQPTLHPPGSAEKIAVLTVRAARGEALFHPDDILTDLKAWELGVA